MKKDFVTELDKFSDDYYAKNKISGVLRVTLKDRILYERYIGFANSENETPFTKASVFTFYSLSKPFCAMGLLKLWDKGVVDINAHPSEYVPEAKGFDARVQISQMLHHVSGLPDFVQTAKFDEKYGTGLPQQMREHLSELAKYPMVFEPGTSWMYANINYILAALIIENVTDMKYADYMKEEIFEPLMMRSAQTDNEKLVVPERVSGHELIGENPVPVDRTLDWMLGAGDIIGRTDDVYCLNKAIKSEALLKKETWKMLLDNDMGCFVSTWHGRRRITHNGGSRGFRTLHIQLPEDDFDIIFLSNSGWGDARNDFAEAVYKAFYGGDDEESEQVKMDVGYI